MKVLNNQEVPFYPSLINDYINGELNKKLIINWEYSESQILENTINRKFTQTERVLLVNVLQNQYKKLDLTVSEKFSLKLLEDNSTFTITTGHQLNLLGGAQFFYTKILDVIRLSEKLTGSSNFDFVPVFWMATEDHDYDEISYVNLFGKKICCPGKNEGPVGRISNSYFTEFLEEIKTILGDGGRFLEIKNIITRAFVEEDTLADITRSFVRALFAEKGLLVIDGDDAAFKQKAAAFFIQEIKEQTAFKEVNEQIKLLADYKIQVNPREINLFYIEDKIRTRIVETDVGYSTANNQKNWTKSEFEVFVRNTPEFISPNVLLRPLYQEVILPNVAYMGGAGEISYWLQLAPMFKAFNIQFPLPIVRTSYFVVSQKQLKWLGNLGIDFKDLFGNTDQLINDLIKRIGSDEISFFHEKQKLVVFYQDLLIKSKSISADLEKVILGEEKRALVSLVNLEKRFANAEKKKHQQTIDKLQKIISKVFPNGSPMERVDSFIPLIATEDFNFPMAPNLFLGEIIIVSY